MVQNYKQSTRYTKAILSIIALISVSSLSLAMQHNAGNANNNAGDGVPLSYANLFNMLPMGLDGRDRTNVGWSDLVRSGVKTGFEGAINDTARTTIGEGLKFIPAAVKGLSAIFIGYMYKLSYGTTGLTWNKLVLVCDDINAVVAPYTVKSYDNNTRVRRTTDINQDMNPEIEDKEWLHMQKYIQARLKRAVKVLSETLPCYNLIFYNARHTGIKRAIGNWMHSLSLKDNDSISDATVNLIELLNTLHELFKNYKSAKDAEQNLANTKQWLTLTVKSFKRLAQWLDGDVVVQSGANGRLQFAVVNGGGGGMQGAQTQMNDLFGGGAGGLNLGALGL